MGAPHEVDPEKKHLRKVLGFIQSLSCQVEGSSLEEVNFLPALCLGILKESLAVQILLLSPSEAQNTMNIIK